VGGPIPPYGGGKRLIDIFSCFFFSTIACFYSGGWC